jgi:hypothetical protein
MTVVAAAEEAPVMWRENDEIFPFKERPSSILVPDTVMVPIDSDMVMLQVTAACEVAGAYSMHRLRAERMLQVLVPLALVEPTSNPVIMNSKSVYYSISFGE